MPNDNKDGIGHNALTSLTKRKKKFKQKQKNLSPKMVVAQNNKNHN